VLRCVCRAGKHWGDGVTERLVWHVVKQYAAQLGLTLWLRTIFATPVPSCAIRRRRTGPDSIPAWAHLGPNT
jgi:hypothetical protein